MNSQNFGDRSKEFITFIFPCNNEDAISSLKLFLKTHQKKIIKNFLEFEILIITPIQFESFFGDSLKNIDDSIKQASYIMTIDRWDTWDSAVISAAGRSNGDFTLILDPYLNSGYEFVEEILKKGFSTSDIFKSKNKKMNIKSFRDYYYFIIFKLYSLLSGLDISILDRREYSLSRRVLNSILTKSRSNILLIELLQGCSFPSKNILINNKYIDEGFSKTRSKIKRRVQWATLMRMGNIPSKISSITIVLLFLLTTISSINALFVRYFGINIIGEKVEYVPGWTFLVIIISAVSLFISISIYALQQTILVVHDELSVSSNKVNTYKKI